MRRTTRALVFVMTAAAVVVAGPVYGSTITFDYNVVFSGDTPGGSSPYLRVTLDDTAAQAGFDVRLTATTVGLVGQEFISEFSLNVNDATIDPTLITAALINNPNGSFKALNTGTNGFKSGGDGHYDLMFDFFTNNANRFGANQVFTVDLNLTTGTLTAASFNFLSQADGDLGPFFAAAHLQGIAGGGSAWIADGTPGTCVDCTSTPAQVTPVPEPATLAMLGWGVMGLVMFARRRTKAE